MKFPTNHIGTKTKIFMKDLYGQSRWLPGPCFSISDLSRSYKQADRLTD